MTPSLTDLRVLLVEDEMLVCLDIEDMLREFGCKVVGPAAKVERALSLIDSEQIDMAILDVNLGRERSYPIADRLIIMKIPFLLSTGYAELDPPYNTYKRLQKPFLQNHLRACLEQLCAELMDARCRADAG